MKDRSLRLEIDSLYNESKATTTLNNAESKLLAHILSSYGWPNAATIGPNGVEIMGKLLLKDSNNFNLQRECYHAMMDSDEIDPRALAQIIDLIRLKQNMPQALGSIFAERNGRVVIKGKPVDQQEVNAMRDDAGLPFVDSDIKAIENKVAKGESVDQANAPPPLFKKPLEYKDVKLRNLIFAMQQADQDARQKMLSSSPSQSSNGESLPANILALDRTHETYLMNYIRHAGMPDASLIGRDGVDALIGLIGLILHFPDTHAQLICLPMIKVLFFRGEVTHQAFAMLYDKVMVRNGYKQLYGTQVDMTKHAITLSPVLDQENLDARRLNMALPPEADYLQILAQEYGLPVSKGQYPSSDTTRK